ncbi:histidine kinase [Flavihumibacter rivuli]|uniref:sensor histidine kinase n=1 Tax=Flavihumibacter rivuli TaxID=2838156 RepID=UPI001BDE9346|nr:histidine kinase [Flavihumibacter rivuli]ULQ55903.1 histidine kinase [Flavihumibacter rivuli]
MKGWGRNNIGLTGIIAASYTLLWIMASVVSSGGNVDAYQKNIPPLLWQMVFISLTNILLFHLLAPMVRKRRHRFLSVLVTVIVMALCMVLGYWYWNLLGSLLGIFPKLDVAFGNSEYMVRTIMFQLYGIAFFAVIRLLVNTSQLRYRNQELQLEKTRSELNYLRSQTNPHFLFNTLNNIYALSRVKSDKAPESILRLADLLRYMLYETRARLVPVEQEIKIIREYIELEELRYNDSFRVNFSFQVDQPGQLVPPLLMIPLVENAFKHGAAETVDSAFVDIKLRVHNDLLQLTVVNSMGKEKGSLSTGEGIGLANLRRQLELLFGEYTLQCQPEGDQYRAYMELNLLTYAKDDLHHT